MGLAPDWLATDPDAWEKIESFRVAKEFVRTVKVINDVAERGVKLAGDYATLLTKDDKIRAIVLQGVERFRKIFPNFYHKTLDK